MKARTIENNIRSKIVEFAASIDNEELADDLIDGVVVTGGCIASMLMQEPVNDYDLYMDNQSLVFRLCVYYINKMETTSPASSADMCIRLTYKDSESCSDFANEHCNEEFQVLDYNREDNYWCDKALINPLSELLTTKSDKVAGIIKNVIRVEIFCSNRGLVQASPIDINDSDSHPESGESENKDAEKFRPVFLSSNAITLSDKIQIVIRFVGDAKKIHESYDFVHATNYWTRDDGLVTNIEALESILAKELIYRGSLYPLASIFRTRKFIQRDWTVHVGNYVKMAMQLNEFDLTDVKVLEEQLTGVDSLYLGQVIGAINAKQKDDKDFEFNSLYVCELCDRMMGLRKEVERNEEMADLAWSS